MKYILLILTFLLVPLISHAASGLTINLYFGNNSLSFRNPAVQQNLSAYFSSAEFDRQSLYSTGNFLLYISDIYDQELVNKKFNAQLGGFSVEVPYYSTLKNLEIRDSQSGTKILEYNLMSLNTCNANKLCEFERGENGTSCIADCGVSNPTYSKETQQQLDASNGEIKDSDGKILLREDKTETTFSWAAIIVGVVLVGGILAYIIIKKRRHV